MVNITKEAFENNDIEVIVDSVDTLWLNKKNIEETFTSNYKQIRRNI